ncbi:efflux RND transporter periplasmic adaptor subunit [Microbulbifer magnicolonia]|uniref:efflux RND transporter periplasmic adaptor subunit n=1 Tax=Microbulbifer magnicolonia TaxID=3109744 RepID=UPI002B40ECE3|nr:efflux RND transporter periplasmic adaptor subunit [Microbulbifer sp. GG15]
MTVPPPAFASGADHHNEPGEHGAAEERVEIAAKTARKAGIETAVAGPGSIRETVTLYGKTAVDHGSISHVRARFPGPITEVMVEIGDRVRKGQRLATVESNDSLQIYPLLAPIDGQIIDKQASGGEFSGGRVLFTIANYEQLWAELRVFPGRRAQIARGQPVVVSAGKQRAVSTIANLSPGAEGQPFALARAAIGNPEGLWTADLMVQGEVVVSESRAPLVVDNRALQPLRDDTVVFVKVGDCYEARPLQLGRSDGRMTEVHGGLKAGERYVTENSYLIKAHLEISGDKSGAGHHH